MKNASLFSRKNQIMFDLILNKLDVRHLIAGEKFSGQ